MVLDRVGLTGATGMLGRHLFANLNAEGIEVIRVSRIADDGVAEWNLAKWLTHDELDLLFPHIDAVVHAGALVKPIGEVDEGVMYNANVRASLNLGQWALSRDIPMVHISGAIVYENPYAFMQDESSVTGWSGLGGFYGFTKLLAEDMILRLRQKGLKVALLRPTSIYGDGLDKERMVQRFLSTARDNGVIEIDEPISDGFDLVHAADVASLALVALKGECWKTLNVSSSDSVSVSELAQACVDVAGGGRIAVKGKPLPNTQPKVMYSLDNSRVYDHLAWSPVIGIHKGLSMLLKGQYIAGEFSNK